MLHLPHIRDLLSLLRGIPQRLSGHVRIQPRINGSCLSRHRGRNNYLVRYIQHLHPQNSLPEISILESSHQTRNCTNSRALCLLRPLHRAIPVRLGSTAEIHWIVPTIGIAIFPACVFILMQCVFLYIPGCYPQYAASMFAATDFTRGAFVCGAIIFSRPLYLNLGIEKVCSLLAGLNIGCATGIHLLFHYGEALRRRSRFVAKW